MIEQEDLGLDEEFKEIYKGRPVAYKVLHQALVKLMRSNPNNYLNNIEVVQACAYLLIDINPDFMVVYSDGSPIFQKVKPTDIN
jgi:hypothetical protein